MTRLARAASAATLMLALLPTVAAAAPEREALTARIGIRDLDLGTAAGQQHFRERVRRAAAMACGTATDLRERFDILRCQAEMRDDAKVRLAALTRAHGVELAANASR